MSSRRSSLSLNQKITISVSILAIIAAVFTAFASGHDWFSPDLPGTVEYIGRVIDSGNQQPVERAKVSLELGEIPLIAYTDSEGVFLFRVVSDLDVSGQIRVEAQGYPIYTRNIYLSQGIRSFEDIRLATMAANLPTETITPDNNLTDTPVPTAISTLEQTNYQCADLSHVQLKVGDSAYVGRFDANLRSSPKVPDIWDQNIVEILRKGTSMTIIGGPVCAHDGTWWEVNTENNLAGWMREYNNGTGYLIEP